MKNVSRFFGILAIAAVFVLAFAACGDGDSATSTEYKSVAANGDVYTLVISDAASRAAYNPKKGDRYELTINPGNKKSIGTVVGVDGGFELLPDNADEDDKGNPIRFSVMVDGGQMIAIGGKITLINDDILEAFVAFVVSSGTPISGSTIANGETVLYHPSISNLAAAKAVREFPYKAEMRYDPPKGELIAPYLEDTPTLTIEVSAAGKATIILPDPKSEKLHPLIESGPFANLLISDPKAMYFGTEGDPIVFIDKVDEYDRADDNTYGLVCARDNAHLVGLAWVDRPTVMKGALIDTHPDAPYYLQVFDCLLEAGWNFVLFTFTGAEYSNVLFTTSKELPLNYRWTVADHNYFD